MEFVRKKLTYREYVELHQAITEVYSEYPFSAEQDDGVNLYIDASFDICNKVTDYIDKHADDDVYVPPELISFALPLNNYAHIIYKDGKFYE